MHRARTGVGAQAESTTAGEAAGDSRGLPRYKDGRGGASSTGQGGSEGAPGGPNKPFNAGALLDRNGDGSYRVSAAAMKMWGSQFQESFGFDVSRAKIEFGWAYGSPAYTSGDRIVVDTGWWNSNGTVDQSRLLVHELTHCVQYDHAGTSAVMARRAVELMTNGPKGQYDVKPQLAGITNLKALNVMDTRFTLESIASHVEEQMILNRPGNGARRWP